MWKPLKGQDRKLPSVKVVYPYGEIEWNRFDTQICLGEFHQDSCSKTGEIIKVDYRKYGLYAGVPLLAVILGIILICVCLKKRKREKKFKAWNKRFQVDIVHAKGGWPLSTPWTLRYRGHFCSQFKARLIDE